MSISTDLVPVCRVCGKRLHRMMMCCEVMSYTGDADCSDGDIESTDWTFDIGWQCNNNGCPLEGKTFFRSEEERSEAKEEVAKLLKMIEENTVYATAPVIRWTCQYQTTVMASSGEQAYQKMLEGIEKMKGSVEKSKCAYGLDIEPYVEPDNKK